MKILAVDPGKNYHSYSSWDGSNIVEWGKHPSEDLSFWSELIKKHDKVYVEDQFITKTRNINIKSVLSLIRAAQELITLAKLYKKDWERVSPRSWESGVLHASRKMLRPDLKRMSKIIASEVTGENIKDHDIADAICIGLAVVTKAIKKDEEVYNEDGKRTF